jgi:cytochrome c553
MPTKHHIASVLLLTALATGLWACDAPTSAEPTSAEPTSKRYETTIVASRELGTLKTRVGEEEFAGVMCSTCHSIPGEGPPAERPTELEEFHTGMQFGHGALTCNSCHNPDDRNTLRAANGKTIAFEDTMELCGQCHGPQTRDYRNGAHGGMNGYWDLSKGPRVRNNCVNCHDPHDPAFPTMMPAPPPRDRFFGDSH